MSICHIWYLDAIGEDTSAINKEIHNSIFVMTEFEDIRHVLKGEISIFRWIADLYRARTFMIFYISNMGPFWYMLKEKLLNRIKLFVKK